MAGRQLVEGCRADETLHSSTPPARPAPHCSNLLRLPQATGSKVLVLRLVRAARARPAAVMPLLVVALQQEQASDWQKVAAYRSLQAMLEHGLKVEPMKDFILMASEQLKASPVQQAPRELQLAASNALATLARGHFNPVMTALQRQLKPFGQPDEFTLLTLGKMAVGNVYSCIPFLGITLTTMQTVTRWIKDSQRRVALCTALEQMCTAIQVYLQSWEKSSYPRISTQRFSAYLFPLYVSITRTWLPENNAQVKLAVLKVLSPVLSILLPKVELQTRIHEDIPLFLGQYQSVTAEAFRVTKILGQILEASLMSKNPIPGRHVEPIAGALACQIWPKEWRSPPASCRREDHVAIVPLFLCLARLHPAGLMEFFRAKLTGSQEEGARLELLELLSEIIGTHLPELWSRRRLCLRAVKVVLGDASPKVRLVTLQVIGKLLQADYLERIEGWPLSYISLQLAVSAHRLNHPALRLPLGGLEEKAVEAASLEVLQVTVALGKGTSQELWSKMLRYLMQPQYTGSAGPLCCALRLLAEQRAAQEQGSLEAVASPTAPELLARLLGLAVSPFEGAGRGAAALLLLQALHPEIYRDVAEDWGVEVPALLQHLEGHSQYTLDLAVWESRLLEFLKKSLQRSREAGWSLALAQELSTQMSLYPGSSLEREFLYKAWGTALSAAGDAAGVVLQLRDLLLHTDYADRAQQEGACWCLSHCAQERLPATLKALRSFEQTFDGEGLAHCPPTQGPLQPGRAQVRSALLLLYSSLTLRAPWEQLRPRLGGTIVPRILRHYDALRSPTEDAELSLRFARCVSELSLSVQGGHGAPFQLPHKRALLGRLLDVVRTEPPHAPGSPVRLEAMTAMWHLSRVPARLSSQERREVAQTCVSCTFAQPVLEAPAGLNQALRTSTLSALAGLVEALLEEEGELAAPIWFQEIFQLLGCWLGSAQEWERSQAVDLCARLLQSHCRKSSPPARIHSSQFRRLAGALGPLTGDMLGTIRRDAAECIKVLLRSSQAPAHRNLDWRLHCIRQGLQSESAKEVRDASSRLGKLVIRALPSQEVLPFMCAMLEQLQTGSVACGPTALLWFEVAVRMQGPELRDKVPILVATACSCLQSLEDPTQRLFLAQAVSVLAQHHHQAVCASLLDQPLLHDRTRRDLWAALATHKARGTARGTSTLKLLLAWASAEEAGARPSRVAALPALREAICGLTSCAQLLPLMVEVGYAMLVQLAEEDPGAERPRPASDPEDGPGTGPQMPGRAAAAVLQAVFSKALPAVAQELDAGGVWDLLAQPGGCLRGVALLARALLHCNSPLVNGLLCRLLPALHSPSAAHRDLSLVFCTELTGHPLLHKPRLQGFLVQQLLAAARGGNATLCALAVRGLGGVAEGAPQEVKKQRRALLATLLQVASDAANPEVACESLWALKKVWGHLRRPRELRAVASQVRTHLWHADDGVRAAAFEVFGQLAKDVPPKQGKTWAREAREALAPLLLHFRDPSPAVAKACCAAFLACAPFLGLQDLVGDVDVVLCTEVSGAQHLCLLDKICYQLAQTDPPLLEALIAEMPGYMHCTWDEIRLTACKLSGLLLEMVGVPCLGQPDLDPLLQSLCSLRGDPSAAVKRAASEALKQVAQQGGEKTSNSLTTGHQGRSLLPGWFFSWWHKGSPVAGRPSPT